MNRKWWKESVVYQIYPRSFCDSDGDGVGDLRGIIGKLDYLEHLGVDAVWLSPVYKSPNDDNGYDISDYRDIMDEFGTLADWDELLAQMHRRGIRMVMDLVVNHTSDEHPWFVQSRSSKDNPYRDYYIWRPGKGGREPNNWASIFGGSAWQLDPATGEYYLHLFTRKQPDLNWENPKVRAEIYEMMRWWLKRGVDGFRMDAISMLSKAPGLPDAEVAMDARYQPGGPHYINGPRLREFLDEMKREVLSKYDVFTVGETSAMTVERAHDLAHEENGAIDTLFQFQHMEMDYSSDPDMCRLTIEPWKLTRLKGIMTRWQKGLEGKGWNSVFLCNHDQPRAVSRFGDDGPYRVESAKMLATLLFMLQGTPYIYQGEEIGMTNVAFASIDEYRDVATKNAYRELVEEVGLSPAEAMRLIHYRSRDNSRTPMQWSDAEGSGFTSGTPWIQLNPNYRTINVEQSLADPDSILQYYRKLIRLRRENSVAIYGTYHLILPRHESIYAFTRTLGEDRLLVILNFTKAAPVFTLPAKVKCADMELLIGNYPPNPQANLRRITLRPYEALVYRLRSVQ